MGGSRGRRCLPGVVPSALPIERARLIAAGRRGHSGATPEEVPVRILEAPSRRLGIANQLVVNLLVFEVAILGFLFTAVILFQQKQEGSLRAYRVSPAGALPFVASKGLLWTAATVAYGALFLIGSLRGFGLAPGRWLLAYVPETGVLDGGEKGGVALVFRRVPCNPAG